jgi:RNA polymerase sigma factor (sigma-70 family)
VSTEPILYVEDEEDYQILVRRILGRAGMEVAIAESGREGLLSLQRQRPSMLILDINLPDSDGYSFCGRLREDPAFLDLPILMLTVRRRPDEWLRGFAAGADDYVAKPLNPPELVSRVRACLEARLPSTLRAGPRRTSGGRPSAVPGSPEYQLIQAAVGGNRAAYEVLIEQYRQRLTDHLLAMGSSELDAEDIVSTAFMRAYEKLGQFRGESTFYTWLYRIAQNEAIHLHRPRPSVSLEEMTCDGNTAVEPSLCQPDRVGEEVSSALNQKEAHAMLRAVPRPYRSMLDLHFLRGQSYQAIARKERIPLGTVMSRLFKARKLLQQAWKNRQS